MSVPCYDVADVAWNCNGSIIAVGYGNHSLSSLSENPSIISIWGIFRREFKADSPIANIDVSNAVSSLSFHPTEPSLLACGTFNGEIMFYDISKEEPLICTSRIDEYYHREPINKMIWVPETNIMT